MSNYHTPVPGTPEGAAEHSAEMIGNIEALLRDDDEYDQQQGAEVANANHFFVVSTPNTPMNPKGGTNTSAAPFRPRLASALDHSSAGNGLFSGGNTAGKNTIPSTTTTFTPYAPVHLNLATPPRTSSLRDAVRPGYITLDALKSYTDRHYAVIVNNLDPRTQSKHLMAIFFPLGAVDALAFQSPVGSEDMGSQFAGRKGGIVLFASSEMAQMAAAKIDDFVPHGQTLPLHTTYFGRYEDYLANADSFTMARPSSSVQAAAAAKLADVSGYAHRTPSDSNGSLQHSSVASPNTATSSRSAPNANDANLVSLFLRAASTSTEECDKALEALLGRFAKDPSGRARMLITVSAALAETSSVDASASSHAYPYAQHFLRSLSRYVIQTGLMDPTSPRDLKVACGTVCGAMFATGIVRGNPFGMALRIVSELVDANNNNGDGAPKAPLGEGQRNTLDALLTMGRSWRSHAADGVDTSKVAVEEQFEAICDRLVDEGRYTPAVAATQTALETTASSPRDLEPPAPLPTTSGCSTVNNSVLEGDATDVNTSSASAGGGGGAFQVSSGATPIRAGPTHPFRSPLPQQVGIPASANLSAVNMSTGSFHHGVTVGHNPNNMSVESAASSIGPVSNRYGTLNTSGGLAVSSMTQTPEKLGGGRSFGTDVSSGSAPNHGFVHIPMPPMVGPNGLPAGAMPIPMNLAMQMNIAALPIVGGGVPAVGTVASGAGGPFVALMSGGNDSNAGGSNARHHLMASTVYMTKVPLTIPHTTLRKLFDCFGEFNKVRIYEERKAGSSMNANTVGGGVAPPSSTNAFANRGNFGFVEFILPASSKAMVDFFRNPNSTVQRRLGISRQELEAILSMRVSFARSCIHDHDPDDAVFDQSELLPSDDAPGRKIKSCTFGLE